MFFVRATSTTERQLQPELLRCLLDSDRPQSYQALPPSSIYAPVLWYVVLFDKKSIEPFHLFVVGKAYTSLSPLDFYDATAPDRPLGGCRGWNRIDAGQRYAPPSRAFSKAFAYKT